MALSIKNQFEQYKKANEGYNIQLQLS